MVKKKEERKPDKQVHTSRLGMLRLWKTSIFSSRRRHTRYIGDWSSDVCSSDLAGKDRGVGALRYRRGMAAAKQSAFCPARSEERRVGKECRSRWWLRY